MIRFYDRFLLYEIIQFYLSFYKLTNFFDAMLFPDLSLVNFQNCFDYIANYSLRPFMYVISCQILLTRTSEEMDK